MKKKIVIGLLALSVLTCGCGEAEIVQVNMENTDSINTNVSLGSLIKLGGLLYYDQSTRIVYRYNHNTYGDIYIPYYAPNGLPYKYNPETNTLEEINND